MESKIKRFLTFVFFASATSFCFAWQTTSQNTPYGHVYAAWKASTTDPSVSLVVACALNQSNATVSVATGNLVIGQPNFGEHVVFEVGRGSFDGKGSGLSSVTATITEDGMGMYVGNGPQGLSMRAMISSSDWMKVYWKFIASNRSKLFKDIFGQPPAKPQHIYTFDLRGFSQATPHMALACRW